MAPRLQPLRIMHGAVEPFENEGKEPCFSFRRFFFFLSFPNTYLNGGGIGFFSRQIVFSEIYAGENAAGNRPDKAYLLENNAVTRNYASEKK